ncbi:MAG: plasmid stabilization protein ParE [Comamonadaceae bacterium PBBC2]|nr:MAG: plasmid stabilization protein ParE [Comamonadaceae bacterium PBBC2]
MTLPIIWRASARSDLAKIIRYVANVNPLAARRLRDVLMESVLPVSEHPYLFRQSQTLPAMREIVAHPNYIVYYRVTASCIEVVNVIHTRREFPGQE